MWKLLFEESSERIKIDIFSGDSWPFLLTRNIGLHIIQCKVRTKEASLLNAVVYNLNADFFVVKFCWALTYCFARCFCSLWLIHPHIFFDNLLRRLSRLLNTNTILPLSKLWDSEFHLLHRPIINVHSVIYTHQTYIRICTVKYRSSHLHFFDSMNKANAEVS